MQLRLKLFAALVAGLVAVSSSSAATVTLTRDFSGAPGTFSIYADASLGDNAGIASYGIVLTGPVLTLDHNSPKSQAASGAAGFGPAGFTSLRSADNVPTLLASQDTITPSPHQIYGFGQAAGSFAGLGLTSFDPQTEGATWNAHLLLASGTYNPELGRPDFNETAFDTFSNVYISQGSTAVTPAQLLFQCIGCAAQNTPPVGNDVVIPGYNTSAPGDPQTLNHQFTASDAEDAAAALTWSNLQLVSYTPNYGGTGPGPLFPATMDASGAFSWVSEGSPAGDYIWSATVTDSGGLQDTDVRLTVNAEFVPEPTTLALVGLAMVGMMGFGRRGR